MPTSRRSGQHIAAQLLVTAPPGARIRARATPGAVGLTIPRGTESLMLGPARAHGAKPRCPLPQTP